MQAGALVDGITMFWRTVDKLKCGKYIRHLRKVIPKVIEFTRCSNWILSLSVYWMINIPLCFIYLYSAIPQLRSLAMYTSSVYPWLCTRPLQTCFTIASQEHKTIRKPVKLLVKSDFTSNLRSLRACIPPNNPSLCTHASKQPQRTSMAMYTSLQTTPAHNHGYVYVQR